MDLTSMRIDCIQSKKGRCAICGIPQSLEDLELDHDHITRMPRGFLCKNCNFKLLPRYERFPPQHQDWHVHECEYLKKGKLAMTQMTFLENLELSALKQCNEL